MPERDPRCVVTVAELTAANIIAEWLTHKGYPAEAVAPPPTDTAVATPNPETPLVDGFQVWVAKLEDAEPARAILEDQRAGLEALREREARRAARTGTVTADCEECGQASEWPASVMGTIQDCPHCGKYMDVPDPEENWDDLDFEAEDGDVVDHPPENEQES